MDDIFVDDCVAVKLENPLDPRLSGFVKWLSTVGVLVTSKKILSEYHRSLSVGGPSNFITILNKLQIDGRIRHFSNGDLKAFPISNRIARKLRSNKADWWHIRVVMLSDKRRALSFDINFKYDLTHFPGCSAKAGSYPEDIGLACEGNRGRGTGDGGN